MNYENMSDFDVNKAVSNLVDFGNFSISVNDENETVYILDKDGFDFLPIGHFDPCNNPNDAWTIIIENNISILHACDYHLDRKLKKFKINYTGQYIASAFPVMRDGFNGDELQVVNENPLRAAMICFLKMKES